MATAAATPKSVSPPKPRLVAVDGNGTLLRGDGVTVSDYTRDVLQRVEALGIPVVLATARPFAKARATCELAGISQYVVTENGARAVRIGDGTSVHESWLEGPEAAAPLQRIRAALPGCFFVQLVAEGGIIEANHPWLQNETQREVAQRLFAKTVAEVPAALAEPGMRCAKAYITVPDAGDFEATMAELRSVIGDDWELRKIQAILPGVENTCDLQNRRVNKVDGVAGLCASLGLPMESCWAFGDDANDRRLLSEVGWGVRMLNHKPQLADVGHDVTQFDNDADGVARYLEAHLLQASER